MANVVPYSFAQELLKGQHNFPTNTIYIALYAAGSGAPYTVSSTAYSSGVANQVGILFKRNIYNHVPKYKFRHTSWNRFAY
jgi:hypothetical protein